VPDDEPAVPVLAETAECIVRRESAARTPSYIIVRLSFVNA